MNTFCFTFESAQLLKYIFIKIIFTLSVLLRTHIISINSLSMFLSGLITNSLLTHCYFYHVFTVSNTSTVSQYIQNDYTDIAY